MEQQLANAQHNLAEAREERLQQRREQARALRWAEKGEHALDILNTFVSLDSKGDRMTATMRDTDGNLCIETSNPELECRTAALEELVMRLSEQLEEQNEIMDTMRRAFLEKKKKPSLIGRTKKDLTEHLGIK